MSSIRYPIVNLTENDVYQAIENHDAEFVRICLAYDLLEQFPFLGQSLDATALANLAFYNQPVKALNAIIHEADVTQHVDKTNWRLLEILRTGCMLANHVRSHLNQSDTHPSANYLPAEGLATISSIIEKMRADISVEKQNIPNDDINRSFKKILRSAEHAYKNQAGNCLEYSDFVLVGLVQYGFERYCNKDVSMELRAERFDIANGDHTFVVLGRALNSDPDDISTWGAEAVVVDAWAGEVYPASDIPNKLRNYTYCDFEERYFSLTVPYDSQVHILNPNCELLLNENFYQNIFASYTSTNQAVANEITPLESSTAAVADAYTEKFDAAAIELSSIATTENESPSPTQLYSPTFFSLNSAGLDRTDMLEFDSSAFASLNIETGHDMLSSPRRSYSPRFFGFDGMVDTANTTLSVNFKNAVDRAGEGINLLPTSFRQ